MKLIDARMFFKTNKDGLISEFLVAEVPDDRIRETAEQRAFPFTFGNCFAYWPQATAFSCFLETFMSGWEFESRKIKQQALIQILKIDEIRELFKHNPPAIYFMSNVNDDNQELVDALNACF